ncbi:MAG: hypothetical protein KAS32_25260 [Candidatus Peribacteraceae bacterium]|nr:hypothetical protein [Candidatus Peribacteraceae bacterium]
MKYPPGTRVRTTKEFADKLETLEPFRGVITSEGSILCDNGNLKHSDHYWLELDTPYCSNCCSNFKPKPVMETRELSVWVNVYPSCSVEHPNEEMADWHATSNRIACVELKGSYQIEV